MLRGKTRYDDGNWYACTLGFFIGLLVDAGHDPAVKFRVVHDTQPDTDGKFIRTMEVILIPDGHVREQVSGCHTVHRTLADLLEAGVVK